MSSIDIDILFSDKEYEQLELYKLTREELSNKDYIYSESKYPYFVGYNEKINNVIDRGIETAKKMFEENNSKIIGIYKIKNVNIGIGEILIKIIGVKINK